MANNRILTLPEAHTDVTLLKWADSGGDEVITLASLPSLTGRNGAMHDFGDAARGTIWTWLAFCQFAAASPPIVGETVDVYWREGAESSGLKLPSNDDGTGDVALSSTNKLKNLEFLGPIIVDEAAANIQFARYGTLELRTTHGGPVFYNSTADGIHATVASNGFWMWPRPLEIE